jgi:hypothetical protein
MVKVGITVGHDLRRYEKISCVKFFAIIYLLHIIVLDKPLFLRAQPT